jgi:hypothetical protein
MRNIIGVLLVIIGIYFVFEINNKRYYTSPVSGAYLFDMHKSHDSLGDIVLKLNSKNIHYVIETTDDHEGLLMPRAKTVLISVQSYSYSGKVGTLEFVLFNDRLMSVLFHNIDKYDGRLQIEYSKDRVVLSDYEDGYFLFDDKLISDHGSLMFWYW